MAKAGLFQIGLPGAHLRLVQPSRRFESTLAGDQVEPVAHLVHDYWRKLAVYVQRKRQRINIAELSSNTPLRHDDRVDGHAPYLAG